MEVIGMLALLVAIVFFIIGLIGLRKRKAKRNFLISGAFLIVFIIALATTSPADNSKDVSASPEKEKTTAIQKQPQSTDWKTNVKDLAGKSDLSKTEKADQVEAAAREYSASDAELKDFEAYIVNEFNSGKYLQSIDNDAYMLENIFKARVIIVKYGDEAAPIADFAHDFWQNTKYTYRGADAVDSDSVKSNEDQMMKALAKMG